MELFRQAATIMILGMGLVFVFLAMVILLVQMTAKAVRRYEARSRKNESDAGGRGGDDGPLAAVIAVALHEQR